MNIRNLSTIFISVALGLAAMSWALQVYSGTPYPALFPYVFVFAAIWLRLKKVFFLNLNHLKIKFCMMDSLIFFYLVHVVFTTIYHLLAHDLEITSAFAVIVNYILPVSFYIYFSFIADLKDIKCTFWTIFIASIASSSFFIYETFSKVFFQELTQFALLSHDYSAYRMDLPPEEMNPTRVRLQYRAVGLQDTQPSSAAWVIFGFLSLMAVLGPAQNGIKILFGIFTLTTLIVVQSFTALIGFVMIIIYNMSIIQIIMQSTFRISEFKFLFNVIAGSLIFLLIAVFLIIPNPNLFLTWLWEILEFQFNLVRGVQNYGDIPGQTYFNLLFDDVINFLIGYGQPLGFYIFGDGYVPWIGRTQGGDFGVIETLHSFGIVCSTIFLIPILFLLLKYFVNEKNYFYSFYLENRLLAWSFSILLYVLFAEIHYSIWYNKSVFPIFFIAFGLLRSENFNNPL
jgi:hypothetical protein